MRRVAWVIAVWMLLVSLTGCSRKAAVEPIGEGFSCSVSGVYRDMQVRGTLTREAVGTLTMSFTAPETLDGLTARWDGNDVTLTMHGMSFAMEPDEVPESALGEEIVAAFDAARRGEGERTQKDGKLSVRGNGANGEYVLVFDAATGHPLSLSVPRLPLTLAFTDFKIIKNEG